MHTRLESGSLGWDSSFAGYQFRFLVFVFCPLSFASRFLILVLLEKGDFRSPAY